MFGMPGGWEWIIILIVAILIFGKRLPEVMKSLGKGIVEFKKGIKGVEDEVEDVSSKSPQSKKKIDIENDTAKQEKNS
ncbi:MAG: twin-arginine translocase TatA/TatE family subunit [Candidatus Kuenenia sp.]|nr:twin-arginine translocase TatA/TatE family subunit [Candidatus Kuenenia sp.]